MNYGKLGVSQSPYSKNPGHMTTPLTTTLNGFQEPASRSRDFGFNRDGNQILRSEYKNEDITIPYQPVAGPESRNSRTRLTDEGTTGGCVWYMCGTGLDLSGLTTTPLP